MLSFLVTMALAILVIALARPSRTVLIGLVLATVALVLMVRWHARSTAYRCPACGDRFTLTAWSDFVHPHGGEKKYVRCPRCGESGWCEESARRDPS